MAELYSSVSVKPRMYGPKSVRLRLHAQASQCSSFPSLPDSTLCMGTRLTATSGASLALSTCGDGSSTDLTALTVVEGSSTSTQFLLPGSSQLCVTSAGAGPDADVTVVACADDASQQWTINSNGSVSNSGNCLTVGKAGFGAPVRCMDSSRQQRDPDELRRLH